MLKTLLDLNIKVIKTNTKYPHYENCIRYKCPITNHFKSFNTFLDLGSFTKRELIICLTTDIILEYEEILTRKRNIELAHLILEILLLMPNVVRVEKYFSFGLPTFDPDDQKFLDCAIACGASYLVTEDKHFNEIKNKDLFVVKIITPLEFKAILKK